MKFSKNIDKGNHEHYSTLQEIVRGGYEGEYYRLFDHLSDEVPSYITDEVIDTFSMYSLLKHSYDSLPEKDKKEINPKDLEWQGFDASHEPHYHAARFILKFLGDWSDIGDRAIDTHHSTRGLYPPMIAVCKKYREKHLQENSGKSFILNKEQILGILNAHQLAKERV